MRVFGIIAWAVALPSTALADAPAPYNLPWQLRAAAPATVLRLDSTLALADDAAGHAWVSFLFASYRVFPELSPFIRVGFVQAAQPGTVEEGGASVTNLALGATYGLSSGPLRFAAALGVAAPVGMGGGDTPDPTAAATTRAGILARSAMDNAMFAVNDLVIFPGVDLAYVAHGLTIQLEATLLQLIRARGAAVQPDELKTNLTMGLHVGYFIVPALSVGAELRHQRWLSTPAAVAADMSGANRDTSSLAVGARAHLDLGDGVFVRPGLAYARGIDDPMAARGYNVIQLDVPVSFP